MAAEPILIVDDQPLNAKLAGAILVDAGFEVQTAGDAEEALRLLQGFRPALILLDLQLPGMDGFELARRLKADPDRRDIVILALTAYAMKGDEARARAAGCDGYLAKPVDTELLPREVRRLLSAASGEAPQRGSGPGR
jgi:CheY-like chemotaxis protein